MSHHKNPPESRVTVPRFVRMKADGNKIRMITAYDFVFAQILDECGVESILVGDSLGMVVQGRENTIPVTLDEMIYHAAMVCRGVRRALVVVDIPFPGFHAGRQATVAASARILKETGAHAVKLEGGAEQADAIAALARAGIPVVAHIGLRPQTVLQMGGYRVDRDVEGLLKDAEVVEKAGAFAIVLECIPESAAAQITAAAGIPTIGIGAGRHCDGQVLVLHDILGLMPGKPPKHARQYASLRGTIKDACIAFCEEVRDERFPGPEHSFH